MCYIKFTAIKSTSEFVTENEYYKSLEIDNGKRNLYNLISFALHFIDVVYCGLVLSCNPNFIAFNQMNYRLVSI